MYFDAHTDLLFDVDAKRAAGERQVLHRRHLPRLRQGGAFGALFVLWLEPRSATWQRTERMMASARAELAETPEVRLVTTVREAEQARREGCFFLLPGIEGMDAIGEDLRKLEQYHAFGCRHGMLTWNGRNALAGGAKAQEFGLSQLGKQAVRWMQRHSMAVDVSHLSDRSFWDVLRLTEQPVIASHSNCRALCEVPRNLTDDQLRAIRDCGGVVGLNAYHEFLHPDRSRQTAEQLARHAAHIIDLCGIETVGCGFDFCEFLPGEETEPRTIGLADSGEVPNFFECLCRMGLRQDEIDAIAYGNFRRVLTEILCG